MPKRVKVDDVVAGELKPIDRIAKRIDATFVQNGSARRGEKQLVAKAQLFHQLNHGGIRGKQVVVKLFQRPFPLFILKAGGQPANLMLASNNVTSCPALSRS
jgi:hypothetical protein